MRTERVARWNAFTNKKRTTSRLEFDNVVEGIKIFLVPIVESLNKKEIFGLEWVSEKSFWT
jgi:hypothetical protein